MNHSFFTISLFCLALFATGCNVPLFKYKSNSRPVTHELWDSLLRQHVTVAGQVDYKGILQDSVRFNKYLDVLGGSHPNEENWSRDERLAYWINAYNAFTVKLILDHYPLESIKDIKDGIVFINTVWDIKFIKIEGATYDLNNIEHGIIRKRFEEPRIHFAVNCASKSCPRLRNEAYRADMLDEQLTNQTKYFLMMSGKNNLSADEAGLSPIFKWFEKDFKKKEGSVIKFVNKYADMKINKNATIKYLDYDWSLNQ